MARMAAVGAGILLLAGCATGYSFVQPEGAGSGGYYTSEAPYSGQGYYDYYGTGPYYPGTSGWGYYNGTWPYGGAYGYYDPGYGYGAYGPQWTFNLGFSNVWNFPGYWGPWYTTGGCYSWCGSHHHGHGHHHDHDSGSWHPGNPSEVGQTEQDRERAREITAWQHDYMRAPRRLTGGSAVRPELPAYLRRRTPDAMSFGGQPTRAIATPAAMPAPTAFSRAPRPAAPRANVAPAPPIRLAPPPAVQPTRSNAATATKIR
ncbi:MAG TPA: hypothetical protein VFX04_08120 [Rhodanobacteraceae bacterium]|nr:hypothetical protein [Rhodanobacteraceae bacterium]